MRFEKNGNTIIAYFAPPVNGLDMIVFSAKTITAWYALLGLTSPAEALAAMVQAQERKDSYDDKTGRNAWTGAYEALYAALNDAAPPTVLLTADGTFANDPLQAAQSDARMKLGLPAVKSTPGVFAAVDNAAGSSSGIDMSVIDERAAQEFFDRPENAAALDAAAGEFYSNFMPQDRRN